MHDEDLGQVIIAGAGGRPPHMDRRTVDSDIPLKLNEALKEESGQPHSSIAEPIDQLLVIN